MPRAATTSSPQRTGTAPGGVAVRELFGIDFDMLTILVGVPLVDRTQKAAP
jgi:hypothetical protein